MHAGRVLLHSKGRGGVQSSPCLFATVQLFGGHAVVRWGAVLLTCSCVQVEFCFTAEGTEEDGDVVSLRGLDPPLYYRSGGVLNCGHALVRTLVVAALRYWALHYHIDGFCFLNAETLVAGALQSAVQCAQAGLQAGSCVGAQYSGQDCSEGCGMCGRTHAQAPSLPPAVQAGEVELTTGCVADRAGTVLDAPPLPEAILFDPILGSRKLIARPGNGALLPRGGERGFPHWGVWLELSPRFPADLGRALHPFPHAHEERAGGSSIASAMATRCSPRSGAPAQRDMRPWLALPLRRQLAGRGRSGQAQPWQPQLHFSATVAWGVALCPVTSPSKH